MHLGFAQTQQGDVAEQTQFANAQLHAKKGTQHGYE